MDRAFITDLLLVSSVILFVAQAVGFLWGMRLLWAMRAVGQESGERLLAILLVVAGAHLVSQVFAVVLRVALVLGSSLETLIATVVLLVGSEVLVTVVIIWGMLRISRMTPKETRVFTDYGSDGEPLDTET